MKLMPIPECEIALMVRQADTRAVREDVSTIGECNRESDAPQRASNRSRDAR
jgi:hypothetical protein